MALPLLIGAAVAGVAVAALLSDDKKEETSYTVSDRSEREREARERAERERRERIKREIENYKQNQIIYIKEKYGIDITFEKDKVRKLNKKEFKKIKELENEIGLLKEELLFLEGIKNELQK